MCYHVSTSSALFAVTSPSLNNFVLLISISWTVKVIADSPQRASELSHAKEHPSELSASLWFL